MDKYQIFIILNLIPDRIQSHNKTINKEANFVYNSSDSLTVDCIGKHGK